MIIIKIESEHQWNYVTNIFNIKWIDNTSYSVAFRERSSLCIRYSPEETSGFITPYGYGSVESYRPNPIIDFEEFLEMFKTDIPKIKILP